MRRTKFGENGATLLSRFVGPKLVATDETRSSLSQRNGRFSPTFCFVLFSLFRMLVLNFNFDGVELLFSLSQKSLTCFVESSQNLFATYFSDVHTSILNQTRNTIRPSPLYLQTTPYRCQPRLKKNYPIQLYSRILYEKLVMDSMTAKLERDISIQVLCRLIQLPINFLKNSSKE